MARAAMRTAATFPARWPRLSRGVFWSWNVVFIVFVYLGLGPSMFQYMFADILHGALPWDFGCFALLLMAVPLLSLGLAIKILRRDPTKLWRYFYAVEVPLMAAGSVRLFLVSELTPGLAYVICMILAATCFCLFELLRGPQIPQAASGRGRSFLLFQLGGQTLALLVAGYLVAVYVPQLFLAMVGAAGKLGHGVLTAKLAAVVIGLPFLLYAALLFCVTPPVLLSLYWRAFGRVLGAAREHLGRRATVLTPLLVAISSIALFAITNRQPHAAVFAQLSRPPRSDGERLALQGEAGALRSGLLNAYLAGHRYLGPAERDDRWREHTPDSGWRKERLWSFCYRLYGALARPLLFDGQNTTLAKERAAKEYASFFDADIRRAEHAAILRSLTAVADHTDRQKAQRFESEQKVLLTLQEVRAERHGDWAEIELHERYESRSGATEEFLYYFSLPESSAVTGLQILNDHAQAKTVAGQVAARRILSRTQGEAERAGSASELLEQIGPRQYRLRIPVRVQDRLWRGTGPGTPIPVELRLRYRVLSDGQGFPLPQLLDRRQVYWTADSVRSVEGRALADAQWLPERLPGAAERAAHEVVVAGQRVRFQPLSGPPETLPRGRTLAVIVDRSSSMSRVRQETEAALRQLRELAGHNDFDFYLTSAPTRGEPPRRIEEPAALPAATLLFYGGDRLYAMLSQFQTLQAGKRYDGVLLLSDDASLDSTADDPGALVMTAPLWLVHLGGRLAPGYNDATQLAIRRSGGGVTTQLAEALSAIERRAAGPQGSDILDGYSWMIEPAEPGVAASSEGLAALAARYLIRSRTRGWPSGLGSEPGSEIDGLHRLAVNYGIVSEYSSLVGSLTYASPKPWGPSPKDRFALHVESGNDQVHESYEAIGTPEPGTWLLLGVVLLALVYGRRQRVSNGLPSR